MNIKPENLNEDRVPQSPVNVLNVTIPSLAGPKRYEDLWEIDVAEDFQSTGPRERDFKADLKRWYLRLN